MGKRKKRTKKRGLPKRVTSTKALQWQIVDGDDRQVLEVICVDCGMTSVLDPAVYSIQDHGMIKPAFHCQHCRTRETRRLAYFDRDTKEQDIKSLLRNQFGYSPDTEKTDMSPTDEEYQSQPQEETAEQHVTETNQRADDAFGESIEEVADDSEKRSEEMEKEAVEIAMKADRNDDGDATGIEHGDEEDDGEPEPIQEEDAPSQIGETEAGSDSSGSEEDLGVAAEAEQGGDAAGYSLKLPDAENVDQVEEEVETIVPTFSGEEARSVAPPPELEGEPYRGLELCMPEHRPYADAVFGDPPLYGQIPGYRTNLIFDIGAGVGHSALWFRAQCPEARIVCVEGDAGAHEMLDANLSEWENTMVIHGSMDYDHDKPGTTCTVEQLMQDCGADIVDICKLRLPGDEVIKFLERAPLGRIGLLLWTPKDEADEVKRAMRDVIGERMGIDFGGNDRFGFDRLPSGAWRIGQKTWWNRK